MRERLLYLVIGAGAGFLIGLLAFLLVGVVANGAMPFFLWTVSGFAIAGSLVGYLFPKKATDYFMQLVTGMFEGGHV